MSKRTLMQAFADLVGSNREEKSRRLSDPEYRSKKGLTTLQVAIKTRAWAMVDLLPEEVFEDVDATDAKGRSALFHAANNPATPPHVLDKLLKAGADPLLMSTGLDRNFCPLTLAVYGKELATAERLWNAAVLKHGDDALCRQRLLRVPDLKVDLSSSSPGSDEHVAALRKAREDTKEIYLPRCLAESDGRFVALVWLIQKLGVESLFAAYPEELTAVFSPFVAAVEHKSAITAIHLAHAWKATGKPFPPSFGLSAVVKPGGWTPMHLAAKRINAAFLVLLLELGVETNVHKTDGQTPLSLAAAKGHDGNTHLLLLHGADPCALVDGKPIHEQPRFVQKLIPEVLRYLKSRVPAVAQ